MSSESNEEDVSEAEIARRMDRGVRRALNTPPMPMKELIGKSERALARRESRVRKAPRSKPKCP